MRNIELVCKCGVILTRHNRHDREKRTRFTYKIILETETVRLICDRSILELERRQNLTKRIDVHRPVSPTRSLMLAGE